MFSTQNQAYFNIKKTSSFIDSQHIKSTFSHNGKMMATSGDISIIYDITQSNTGCSVKTRMAIKTDDRMIDVSFSPDDTKLMVTASYSGAVYSTQTGDCLFKFSTNRLFHTSAVFSPNGVYIASCDRTMDDNIWTNSVKIYEVESGRLLRTLTGFRTFVTSPQFFGTKLIISSGNTAKVWDVVTGKELLSLTSPSIVFSSQISPDGKTIAFCSKGVTFYNMDGTIKHGLMSIDSILQYAVFSPDSEWLLSSYRDKKIRLYNVSDGSVYKEFEAIYPHVFAFSPDSKTVAIAEKSGIFLWSISNQPMITRSHSNCWLGRRSPYSICFSPCGNKILASYQDGSINIWEPDPEEVSIYKETIKAALTCRAFYGTSLKDTLGDLIIEYAMNT